MSFPIDKFRVAEIEQIDDIRTPKTRYYRDRAVGNKDSYFMIPVTSIPLKYNEYMRVSAIIQSYRGSLEIFELNNPFPAIESFTNLALDSNALAKQSTIYIDGSRGVAVGDFIQFSNHPKVYWIADVSTAASRTTVKLTCPLAENITTSDSVIYGSDVVFQVCLGDSLSSQISSDSSKYGVVDVELIEQA